MCSACTGALPEIGLEMQYHAAGLYGSAAAIYAVQSVHTCPLDVQTFLALCCAQMRLQVGASWLQQAAATGQSAARRVLSGQSPFP